MHCSKVDLVAASDYFGGLLRSPRTEKPPVHMKHVQPHKVLKKKLLIMPSSFYFKHQDFEKKFVII